MSQDARSSRRFGQGVHVDRSHPHIFHRDYWTLKLIRESMMDFLEKYGPELRGGKALDFGAGDSPYGRFFQTTGAELLRADIKTSDTNVLQIGSDGRIPLKGENFRAVVSTQVLEHVPDVQRYLAEARRLLVPRGLLFISTHGAFILHGMPDDFRRWTTDGLRLELELAGFEVLELEPKLGILAMSSHLRSIALGGLTRRIPMTGWLRPVIYLIFNARMAVEQWLTPRSAMDAHPELLVAIARKS